MREPPPHTLTTCVHASPTCRAPTSPRFMEHSPFGHRPVDARPSQKCCLPPARGPSAMWNSRAGGSVRTDPAGDARTTSALRTEAGADPAADVAASADRSSRTECSGRERLFNDPQNPSSLGQYMKRWRRAEDLPRWGHHGTGRQLTPAQAGSRGKPYGQTAPAGHARVEAEFLRQVFPGDPRVQNEQDDLEHQPVGMPLASWMSGPTLDLRQQRLDHRPQLVIDIPRLTPNHPAPPDRRPRMSSSASGSPSSQTARASTSLAAAPSGRMGLSMGGAHRQFAQSRTAPLTEITCIRLGPSICLP